MLLRKFVDFLLIEAIKVIIIDSGFRESVVESLNWYFFSFVLFLDFCSIFVIYSLYV